MAQMDNIHKGHRHRVRMRFINDEGLENFEYHQILELLLFYAVPMKDTNELAHKLLNEYGSFHNLLNAKPQDIMQKCGVSESTAVLISLIPHLSRAYSRSVMEKKAQISSLSVAVEILNSILGYRSYECFCMLCLDKKKRLIKEVILNEGAVDGVQIYPAKLVETVILHKACYVILGHNHPAGTCAPSEADVNTTRKIINALSIVNVDVLDHIIVCGDSNFSFAEKNVCGLGYRR